MQVAVYKVHLKSPVYIHALQAVQAYLNYVGPTRRFSLQELRRFFTELTVEEIDEVIRALRHSGVVKARHRDTVVLTGKTVRDMLRRKMLAFIVYTRPAKPPAFKMPNQQLGR